MTGRYRYHNQWTLKREAVIITAFLSTLATLFFFHLTGQASTMFLRGTLVLAIMAIPALIGAGFWLGTMQVRGYEKGMKEKLQFSQVSPPVYIPPDPQGFPALPSVTHQEIRDAQTT